MGYCGGPGGKPQSPGVWVREGTETGLNLDSRGRTVIKVLPASSLSKEESSGAKTGSCRTPVPRIHSPLGNQAHSGESSEKWPPPQRPAREHTLTCNQLAGRTSPQLPSWTTPAPSRAESQVAAVRTWQLWKAPRPPGLKCPGRGHALRWPLMPIEQFPESFGDLPRQVPPPHLG